MILAILATGCLLQGLKSKPYSPIGTYPHSWLSTDYIKSPEGRNSRNNYVLGSYCKNITSF